MAIFTAIVAGISMVGAAVGVGTAAVGFGALAGASLGAVIVGGAVVGAVIGGVVAAVKGESILDGVLKGGLIGAAGAGALGVAMGVGTVAAANAAAMGASGTAAEAGAAAAATGIPMEVGGIALGGEAGGAVGLAGSQIAPATVSAGMSTGTKSMLGLAAGETLLKGYGDYAAQKDAEEQAALDRAEREKNQQVTLGVGGFRSAEFFDKNKLGTFDPALYGLDSNELLGGISAGIDPVVFNHVVNDDSSLNTYRNISRFTGASPAAKNALQMPGSRQTPQPASTPEDNIAPTPTMTGGGE